MNIVIFSINLKSESRLRCNIDFGDVNNLIIKGKMITLDLVSQTSKIDNMQKLKF